MSGPALPSILFALLSAVAACGAAPPPSSAELAARVFVPNCATGGCHGAPESRAAAFLVLSTGTALDSLVEQRPQSARWPAAWTGRRLVEAGDPDASALVAVLRRDADLPEPLHMPPGRPLTDTDFALVLSWVESLPPRR